MTEEIHKHYHAFIKHMNKTLGLPAANASFCGIEAIEAAEKYAKANPKIKIAPCDDNMFASSIIVLVPHPGTGTSFLFIPQLTNEQGNLFLYPNHMKALQEKLKEVSTNVK